MSKKSNKFESSESEPSAAPAEAPKPTRRRRWSSVPSSKPKAKPLERYRGILVAALVVLGIGVVGFFFMRTATASVYTCESLLEEPAEVSPQLTADGEELLGFAVADAGERLHNEGTIEYATCPPTSGAMSATTLQRQFYDAGAPQPPNNWVHNLEHGYVIIAYSGDPGEETLSQLRMAMENPEPSAIALQCGLPNKVLALRFDDMSKPFAVLAWDRALLMDTFDLELASTAAEQFQDQRQSPEAAC